MSNVKAANTLANYTEPNARGITGCHNCTRVQMLPSMSGQRQPYCGRRGCWVKEMAICDNYAMKPATQAITGATT